MIFHCCQLPGGNNSSQSFVGPRQTPLWKRSAGTIWLEEEDVHCSAQLRIFLFIYFFFYNGSTWCSERGLTEQELERHEWSISANKAGENSNISLGISCRSPSRLFPSPVSAFPPFSSGFNVPPSPHVNLLLQWHASLGESFLITPTAPARLPLSHAQRCHSNYEA